MTAQPEEVDVERVLGQATLPQTYLSAESLPIAEVATSLWRVVAADGSTRVFDLALPTDRPHDHQPAGDAETPVRPQSSDTFAAGMLEADTQQRFSGEGQPGLIADARRLDAAVALDAGGQCAPGETKRSGSVAARVSEELADPFLSQPAVAPRVTARCRYIDPQLARIIDLWSQLPQGVQAAMLAMTEASREHR